MRLTLLISLFVSLLSAQTDRATLTGVVMDPSRSVVPTAKVTLHAVATGLTYAGLTNAAGVYTFSGMPVGQYSASIVATGFESLQIQTFTLEVGETRTLNAMLRVGAVSSNVTVMEAAPDLELTTSEVGGVIHSSQTNALPVNGRYWASLMALIPGAVSSGTGTQDAIRSSGLSQEDNNFRFDGVDATGLNHQFVKEPARLQFPLESIAEFKASSAVYSADVGGMAGGQVSMVSKSGSNEFHGSAYEYLRNSFFDAKAFDSPAVAPFRMNNFGASFGGPIIRNKLFFFTNYESVRQVFSQQVSGFVPTDAYRAQVTQKSPALASLINAFPKGTIPSADPNALLWISSGRNPTSEDSGLFRIDYNQSSATTISLRFNMDGYRTSSVALAESTFTTMDPPNAVLDVQHSFSPTILNDARIGFNRDNYVDVGDGKTPSSGAVAFGIVSLLPVELILNAGTHAGFAMIFALLFSAILWNLGTWYFGLPNSSSHTLIGSILGVGLMNQLMAPRHTGASGVDWTQAIGVGKSLLFSPLIGFAASALLFLLMKRFVHNHTLYCEPVGSEPPPFWIRSMLVLTCTGVSFAHGSNDGQKGMGLIMLILVGTVPAAYALNHAVSGPEVQTFLAVSEQTARVLSSYASPGAVAPARIRPVLEQLINQSRIEPATVPALSAVVLRIAVDVAPYGALARVPIELSGNIRNDMYLAGEALRIIESKHLLPLRPEDAEAIRNYLQAVDRATKFIPTWVKVAVALALGLGTMVGWKRIVITVGERIGKTHLTYAQGAASEVIAMATILAADRFGLPVSTTHVLTSGVAGTMAANHSGLQWGTLRALAAAWLMTLPVSIALSGGLFWIFRHVM